MAKKRTSELKKKSRGDLVRMAEGAGLDHTGTNEQLISRLAEVQVEAKPTPVNTESDQGNEVEAEQGNEAEAE